MFSESPLTPGRSEHAPRTIRSIRTPAPEASYSALMVASSTSALTLAITRAGLPARARRASFAIAARLRWCSVNGASHKCLRRSTRVRLVRCMNTFSTSVQIPECAVSKPKSVYSLVVVGW